MKRTECDCDKCSAPCWSMPGYLLPDDLPDYAHATLRRKPADLVQTWSLDAWLKWGKTYLEASEGAKLMTPMGKVYRLPTLVPRSGCFTHRSQCIHFSATGCSVHEDAPFGCRMFNVCEDHKDTKANVLYGMDKLRQAWAGREGLWTDDCGTKMDVIYTSLWEHLHEAGFRALPLKKRKKKLAHRLRKLERHQQKPSDSVTTKER